MTMTTIHYTATLFCYDGPLIIESRDEIGGHYVGVLVSEINEPDKYLIKGVSPSRLAEFRAGKIDIRSLLLHMEQDEWYLSDLNPDFNLPMSLMPQNDDIKESGFLPDEGFLLHDSPTDDFVVAEARERNSTILQITTESSQNFGEHRMSLEFFIKLLGGIQSLVKYAYNAEMKDLSSAHKPQNSVHLMDVIVPATAGSFRVVFESARTPQQTDFVENTELSRALNRVDELFQSVIDYDGDTDTLEKHRGHLAGCYLNLLKLLSKNKTDITYAWATQHSTSPSQNTVSVAQAKELVESLSKIADLGTEKVIVDGEFEKFNRSSGAWGLLTEEGRITGKIRKQELTLEGLVVGKIYRFHCTEESNQSATGDENRVLYLENYSGIKREVK